MATEMHFYDGVAWRKAKEIHFHDGSAWRKANEVHVHDGSAWRKVFQAFTVDLPAGSIEAGDASYAGSILFYPDGTFDAQALNHNWGNWGTPASAGIGSGYWLKIASSYTGSLNLLKDTWYQLSSVRMISTDAGEGQAVSGTVYISNTNADGGIIDSCGFTVWG